MLLAQWPSTVGLLYGAWCSCVLSVPGKARPRKFSSAGCVVVGCVVGKQLVHHKLLHKCNMFEKGNGAASHCNRQALIRWQHRQLVRDGSHFGVHPVDRQLHIPYAHNCTDRPLPCCRYNAAIDSDEPQVILLLQPCCLLSCCDISARQLKGYMFGMIAQMGTWVGNLWTLIMVSHLLPLDPSTCCPHTCCCSTHTPANYPEE